MDQGGRLVELDLPSDASWRVEDLPTEESRELRGDRLVVRLRVHGEAWLDKLLLSLGPDATGTDLTDGSSLDVRRAAAARRLLERHGRGAADPPG
jgi:hypothetical protein